VNPSPDQTILQAFELAYIPRINPSPQWQQQCRVAISYWRQMTADPPIKLITSEVAQDFIREMRDSGLASQTIRMHWGRIFRVIRLFYKKDNAHRRALGLLTDSPPRVIYGSRQHSKTFSPLSMTLYDAWWKFHRPTLIDAAPATIAEYEITLRKWETYTNNPPIRQIDNGTLDSFKATLLGEKLAPATVNKRVHHLRVILRRLGPQETRYPAGLGILYRVPYTKKLREPAKLPRVLTQEQLAAIFTACDVATWPAETKTLPGDGDFAITPGYGAKGTGIPPADFWRAIVVLAYNLGLSKEDLFGLRHDEVDFDACLITLVRGKTNRVLRLPMNDHVRNALATIWRPEIQDGLFYESKSNRQLYKQWHAIQNAAGISIPYFGFHDIRRTCATEFERLQAGAGTFMLGHSTPAVTWRHYRNPSEATKQAAAMLPQPGSQKMVRGIP
jgi:integrase